MIDRENMHISFNNPDSHVDTGFGHATFKILTTLAKMGYPVVRNRKSAIEITFAHPEFYAFIGDTSYKVGYTAWESTQMKPGWDKKLEVIDELWVPNTFCKNVFSEFFDKDIRVFPHGVSENFNPFKREVKDKFIFLHMGFPAVRKNLPDTVNAFLENFAGREDVELWIKGYDTSTIFTTEKNIKLISGSLPYDQIVNLMHQANAMIYPTWGEGFGLIPLQAMATGMPVILTDGWADYQYLANDLIVDTTLEESPWQTIHPGKMLKPNYETLVEKVSEVYNNYDEYSQQFYNNTTHIHDEWSWNNKVENHFSEFLHDLYNRKVEEALTSGIPSL